MPRLPLYSGSRIALVTVPDDAVLLAAPPPVDALADVTAAVAEALRYPLSGPRLADVVPRGAAATVVIQPPVLPLPSVELDPRRAALGAVLDALERGGAASERITLLFAGGLGRRPRARELDLLLRPGRARDFRGKVDVHDCEADDLRGLDVAGRTVRVHPALVETDLVVTVGAAETTAHGGAAALVDACGAGTIRAGRSQSLLEPSGSSAWQLATALEAVLASSRPVLGVSLVLDHPRETGLYRGYPWDPRSWENVERSPLRTVLNAVPEGLRQRVHARARRTLTAVTVLAGSPSVAHAEALVRGTGVRSVALAAPLDTIVVPLGWEGLQLPREPLTPITAAALGLGHALRLWRNEPPLVEGGTVVLLHPLGRVMGHPAQAPYRALFTALRDRPPGRRPGGLEAAAARDRRAIAAYRSGAAPHPRQAFADWESCVPVLERAGRVIVAGCRDAGAARALGLVPSHNASTALAMADGLAGGGGRTGVLLGPPYPAVVVG